MLSSDIASLMLKVTVLGPYLMLLYAYDHFLVAGAQAPQWSGYVHAHGGGCHLHLRRILQGMYTYCIECSI